MGVNATAGFSSARWVCGRYQESSGRSGCHLPGPLLRSHPVGRPTEKGSKGIQGKPQDSFIKSDTFLPADTQFSLSEYSLYEERANLLYSCFDDMNLSI